MIAVVLNTHQHLRDRRRPPRQGLRHPGRCSRPRDVPLPPVRVQTVPRPPPLVPGQAVADQHPVKSGGGSRRSRSCSSSWAAPAASWWPCAGGPSAGAGPGPSAAAGWPRCAGPPTSKALDRRQLGRRNGRPGPGPIRHAHAATDSPNRTNRTALQPASFPFRAPAGTPPATHQCGDRRPSTPLAARPGGR